MPYFKNSESAEELVATAIDLMRVERDAIVSGSFEAVYDLTDEKSALLTAIDARFSELAKLDKTPALQARLAELYQLALTLSRNAASNQKLLEAAQQGVEKTREELRAVSANVDPGFYAPGGRKIPVSVSGAGHSRKF